MPTKLSRYAEGVMEAAWLAAIIVVPIFFNVYSSRIFEPDKITLLRSLALVILAAWMIKLLEQGGARWDQIQRTDNGLKGTLQSLVRIPLIGPVLALMIVYILATIFSVTPSTSLWGSYQRLQGTYTTLSYLVVFFALVANLRQREQVDRLVGAMILSSLPVSLYGILQHYGADPIPWGGDVSARIAANMGNSIFIAAYLIMVFPLTLMRVVDAFEALLTAPGNEKGTENPQENTHTAAHFIRATGYVFILALQAIALYFSGSRGPWLGWGASLVLIWLGLSLLWRKRFMTLAGVGLALLATIFLIALNIPSGPLEGLRSRPEFGRLGQLLDAESRTGRVRTLIWKGASELVQPHAALDYPDGRRDLFNIVRPLIGYGPESMYVAYNRFYQPELTLVERRNASPDRAHNETWDSLAITGLLGLLAYLALFGSVIYFGLKWLGLVPAQKWRSLFFALYIFGGVLTAAFFWIWKGLPYLGVALPFGMTLGVILYLILVSLNLQLSGHSSPQEKLRSYLLLGSVAAIIAHFVEINFGIAIASTRTYFWTSTALILLVGYILPLYGYFGSSQTNASEDLLVDDDSNDRAEVRPLGRKKRPASRTVSRSAAKANPPGMLMELSPWLRQSIVIGFLVGLILMTLGYLYISNLSRSPNAITLIWSSLTSLVVKDTRSSFGMLALVLTTWIIGCGLQVAEAGLLLADGRDKGVSSGIWVRMFLVGLGVSILVSLFFWLWHAGGLAALNRSAASTIDQVMAQVRSSEHILTRYYVYLFLLVFIFGLFIPTRWPGSAFRWQAVSLATALAVFLASFGVLAYTNLRVIQADISFKTAELFARPGSWPVAIQIYDRARDLAPSEDYYYLFLGRAYLEQAKSLQDPAARESLINQAAQDLVEAQRLNPLNTDHTANLARLYSLWTTYTDDPSLEQERATKADEFFAQATSLSPNNSRLWDEWAVHKINVLNDPSGGYQLLQHAMGIDPYYDWTYALIADYLARFASNASGITPEKRQEVLRQSIGYYTQALDRVDPANLSSRYSYLIAYGGLLVQLGLLNDGIAQYEQALLLIPDQPDSWRLTGTLAQLYSQIGQNDKALEYARQALVAAPEGQRQPLESLIQQLGGSP